MLQESQTISQLLREYKPLIPVARKLAFWSSPRTKQELKLLEVVAEKFNLNLVSAKSDAVLFMFDKPEEEILKVLKETPLPKKTRTPKKVLVKMLLSRLIRLKEAIGYTNKIMASQVQNGWRPASNWSEVKMISFEELTPDLKSRYSHGYTWYLHEKGAHPLGTFLEREDVTEDVLRDGWAQFEVYEILDS